MRPDKQISKSKEVIQEVMQLNLAVIADSIISKIIRNAKKATKSNMINAIRNIKASGLQNYKSDLLASLAVISSESLDQARKEVPNKKKIKLMENEERLLFGEFDNLPPKLRKKVKTSTDLTVSTQISDLEKAIYFQYTSSLASGKNIDEIKFDLDDKAESYITGNAIQAGSAVMAANIVNQTRSEFLFNSEVSEEIEAYEFINGDPVSPICSDLAGTIFRKDDPNAFRYTPPLHYNCKSWIRPILKLKKNSKVSSLDSQVTKTGKKSIQFHDISDAYTHECQEKCQINL
jgi:SPP1 gp7 family putative phage head morphogenesis protein